MPCPRHCSSHGVCQHGECFCDPGYGGADCGDELRCPVSNGRVCSARGLCVDGACVCVAGVGGAACDEVYSTAAVENLQVAAASPSGAPSAAPPISGGLVEYRTQPVVRAARRNTLAGGMALIETASEAMSLIAHAETLPSNHGSDTLAEADEEGDEKEKGSGLDDVETNATSSTVTATSSPHLDGAILLQTASSSFSRPASPALLSRDATEAALGLKPAVVWPAAALSRANLKARLPRPDATLPYGANAGATLGVPSPPAVCLGACSQRGSCFDGKCFCDPGWEGADCARATACQPGCEQHGACAYGLCWCDPGFEGPACDTPIACPGECNGHGTCANAQCYCEAGWRGVDCATEAEVEASEMVGVWACVGIQLPIAAAGMMLGWGVRYAVQQRQRAKMREILQQDAQRPFQSQ